MTDHPPSPRRVWVTDATAFLGPACVDQFRSLGDTVTATVGPLASPADVDEVVHGAGPFDVVVANLEAPIDVGPLTGMDDEQLEAPFRLLVHPLLWILRTVLPAMVERRAGAVVVPTSATVLRSSGHPIAPYEAARAAQLATVRSVATEVARHGVRVNATAPNFIENPSYFPPETVADPAFRTELRDAVPAGRLGTPQEAAAAVAWLASPQASYLFGAVLPTDGGWSLGG